MVTGSRGPNEALFDQIVIVDWSANSSPKLGADSIWMATVEHGDGPTDAHIENLPTRHVALSAIAQVARPGIRTLLGVDFSLGFPAGTAAALGLAGTAWASMWRLLGSEIIDDDRNANNRFAVAARLNAEISNGPGPFWGCPAARANHALTTTRPDPDAAWPATWRHTELALRAGGRRPFSAWQLHGAGSVGSQSLVGIAALERLRCNLGERISVWPFTTGLQPPVDTDVVVAEVWPSMWPVTVPPGVIKDAAQVTATAQLLATVDRQGDLDGWFTPSVPPEAGRDVLAEEGWVLGAGSVDPGRSV